MSWCCEFSTEKSTTLSINDREYINKEPNYIDFLKSMITYEKNVIKSNKVHTVIEIFHVVTC